MAQINQLNKTTDSLEAINDARAKEPLLRTNFILMIISAVLIVLGFVLMGGAGSGVDEYNPDIFSTRRIVVGPLLSFIGYVVMGIAIIIKPKN